MDDFQKFFEQHYGSVVRALTLAIGSSVRAEDAAQEAFARALRKWKSVSGMASPVGWIYVVAFNAQRREWRREARLEPGPGDVPQGVLADHSDTTLDLLTLQGALARLTARQRAAVVLRYLADLSTADVAAALGCAEGTVKATVHRALELLRVELADDRDGSEEAVE